MKWAQVIIRQTGAELWKCTRLLNPRPRLTVLLVGRARYRCDTKQKTAVRELVSDNWQKYHIVKHVS